MSKSVLSNRGPKGATGPTGPAGPTGLTGPTGFGSTGPTGPVNAQISVANLTALAAYSDVPFSEGAIAYVQSVQDYFRLGSLTTASPMVIVTANSGTKSWYRLEIRSLSWEKQASWEINPQTGSDESSGSPGSPIQTWAEFTRRVRKVYQATTVTIKNNISEWLVGRFEQGSSTASLIVRGDPTATSLGSTTTFTDPTFGTASPWVAPTQGKVTVGGGFNSGHLGRILRSTVSGASSYAPVLSLSTTTANTSWWCTADSTFTAPSTNTLVEILTLVTAPTVQIQSDGFLVRVELLQFTNTTVEGTPYVSTLLADEAVGETVSPAVYTSYWGFLACIFQGNVSSGPGDGTYYLACLLTSSTPTVAARINPQGGSINFRGGGARRNLVNWWNPGRTTFTGFIQDGGSLQFGSSNTAAPITCEVLSPTYPIGIFNSPANGLTLRGHSVIMRVSNIFGTGNTTYGLLAEYGATFSVFAGGITPTITGNTSDLSLNSGTSMYTPPSYGRWTYNGTNVIADSISYAGNNGVGWTKWAQAAGVGGGFNRYMMDLGTGAKIVGP